VVTVRLTVPFGTGHDPEGFEGTGWILGSAIQTEIVSGIASLAGDVQVEVGRGRTDITLMAPLESWEQAYEVLSRVLFREGPSSAAVEKASSRVTDQLTFETGAPARAFRDETYRFLYGQDHPWARPPQGTPQSVSAVSLEMIRGLQREWFRSEVVHAAMVGPLDRADVRPFIRQIGETVEPERTPPDSAAVVPDSVAGADSRAAIRPPAEPIPPVRSEREAAGLSSVAWTSGSRQSLFREVTSTWIAVAFPVPQDVPRTSLQALSHIIQEELTPDPPDPGLYWLRMELDEGPAGTLLLITAAVDPTAASRWEERIVGGVRSVAYERTNEPFFKWQRRRFRTASLLRTSRPEDEAQEILSDVLRGREARALFEEIWTLSAEDVIAASSALGEPRILVYGPDLTSGDTGR
jgi:hypothetical protein